MGANDVSRETSEARPRILIISDVRFLRESLAEVFTREGMASIAGLFANLQEALPGIANNQLDIILLDEAIQDGPAAVAQILCVAPQIPVIVVAITESAEKIIAWAEAGVAGYIPRTAGLADVVPLLVEIMRGKQPCVASVAAGLLRRLSVGTTNGGFCNMPAPPMLTPREAQVAEMIIAGLSNKDIARCLKIALATAKTHVHNVLGKLNLQRRNQIKNSVRAAAERVR